MSDQRLWDRVFKRLDTIEGKVDAALGLKERVDSHESRLSRIESGVIYSIAVTAAGGLVVWALSIFAG